MNVVVAGNMLSKVGSFIIFQSGEGLTSFNKDNSAITFLVKKKKINETFRVSIFRAGEYANNL